MNRRIVTIGGIVLFIGLIVYEVWVPIGMMSIPFISTVSFIVVVYGFIQKSGPKQPQVYTAPPAPQPVPTTPACPNCGAPLEFIEQYNRWYCRSCEKYA